MMIRPWYVGNTQEMVLLCEPCRNARQRADEDIQYCNNAAHMATARARSATCMDCGLRRYARRR